MSFDWKTDEPDWDEPDPPDEPRRRRRTVAAAASRERPARRRPALLFASLALALLAGLGVVLYRQLERRAEAAVERIRADVLASQDIITRASLEQDRELFIGFLSGRDDAWAAAQERLIDSGRYLARDDFGWTWLPGDAPPGLVTVANDLSSAELQAPQRYVIDAGGGLTETITLTQTAVFRPATDRWLLAPPDETYWGEPLTVEGRFLRAAFPERDAATVDPLAADIDALLVRLCTQVEGLECPDDFRVDLTLSTDPASLDLGPVEVRPGGLRLTMPTPSLLGLPVDSGGQKALFRAFAVPVVRNVVAEQLGLEAPPRSLYYGVLLDALLQDLDLAGWPLGPADYARLAREPEAAEALEAYWQVGTLPPAETIWPAYVLVDYLAHELDQPIVPLMREFTGEQGLAFSDWLAQASEGRFNSAADFERALVAFAYEQAPPFEPPFPLPEQALQLVCRAGQGAPPALFRQAMGAEQPERIQTLGEAQSPMLVALPDDSGMVIAERGGRPTARPPTLWRDGQESSLTYTSIGVGQLDLPLVPIDVNPSNGEMLFILDFAFSTPVFGLLQPSACRGPICDLQPVLGEATWSPDGERMLLSVAGASPLAADRRAPLLLLADGQGRNPQSLEKGLSPFWVDDTTFGYVSNYASGVGQSVFLRRLDELGEGTGQSSDTGLGGTLRLAGADETLLTSTDLAVVAPSIMGGGPYIDRVLPVPGSPDRFFIAAAEPLVSGATNPVYLFDASRREWEERLALPNEPALYQRSYQFSPDGRHLLVVSLRDETRPDGSLVWNAALHDIDANATRHYTLEADPTWPGQYLVDWSADGHWLSLLTNGYVRLVALGSDWERPIVAPELDCTAAVWVNAAPARVSN